MAPIPTNGRRQPDRVRELASGPDRAAMPCACGRGATVWLTGLPSAGKSTIALAVAAGLVDRGRRVEILDGDAVRASLSPDLGFSRADRDLHVSRIGTVAEMLARNGVFVLVPVIAPYRDRREAVRESHELGGVPFLEVYVATSLATCVRRDVKGLYAKHAAGELTGLTGVDDPYEAPGKPDLAIDTECLTVTDSARLVLDLLARRDLT